MATKRKTRARQAQLAFDALSIEGGLLSPEWLAKVAQLQAGSQSESDYRVPKGLNLRDEIGRYWRIAQAHWADFTQGRTANADGKVLAERFVTSLLREAFGFASLAAIEPIVIADRSYPIGHAALDGRVPVVIAPADTGFDDPSPAFGDGGRRRSAFALTQEFLNAHDGVLWGLTSNGNRLRIGRDNASLTRPAWIQADLARIFTEERYADFAALWLLVHETRFGREGHSATACVLENWRNAGREEGTRAREDLRKGVKEALIALGQGFLSHPENQSLRVSLQSGALITKDYFNELLRLVYRLIFLLTIEERGLLHPDGPDEVVKQLYNDGYSLRRLRERSVKRSAHDGFSDLWEATKIVFRGLVAGEPRLGLPALAGLFAPTQTPTLDAARLENRALLLAVFRLAWLREDGALARVNWRDMGPEELGSVYESLLELVPQITKDGRQFAFATGGETKGNARKTTGSYYTPDSLVQVLLDSALAPVVAETIAKNPDDPVEALLSLSIVDPACGSGHFLLAAARRLAAHVARLQANGTPSAAEYRHAIRQVVGHSIYGVDLNPMAVELCKVSLWMEAVEPGLPLTFLNSHIQHGNALLGTTPALMANGIPDTAWEPIEGDDTKIARALKQRNKAEGGGQRTLKFVSRLVTDVEQDVIARAVAQLDHASDATPEALAQKELQWSDILASAEYQHQKFVSDAWCAAFVWPKQVGGFDKAAPTNDVWRRLRDREAQPSMVTAQTVNDLAERYRFFHWHLQMPQIFVKGGFDVVLGNPPWERVNISQKEWFASRAPEISREINVAGRNRQISDLPVIAPTLWSEWVVASRTAEAHTHFVRSSSKYPLCAHGDINSYSLFAELNRSIVAPTGAVGCILPSGIATDNSTRHFFGALMDEGSLRSLFEFENEGFFSAGKGHMLRFALVTLEGAARRTPITDFFFQGQSTAELADGERHFALTTADISLINPNTRTCPIFRVRRDAEITKSIYGRIPILDRDDLGAGENPWIVGLGRTFHMGDDARLFRTRAQLLADGAVLSRDIFYGQEGRFLPLYEAKMIYQLTHRYGDVGPSDGKQREHRLPEVDEAKLQDPDFVPLPFYWVAEHEVELRLERRGWRRRWLIGWRDVTDARASLRTVIAAAFPRTATSDKLPLILPRNRPCELLGVLSSFVFDYCARQKLGGISLKQFIFRQLPIPLPSIFDSPSSWTGSESLGEWVQRRVLELSYTAWNLEPFGRDVGYDGPPFKWDVARRFLLRCELDAAFFHLYGISRDDADYIMDTFPIVRKNDEKAHGEYRTKRVILEIYDAMTEARTGQPYQTRLDPPPADPRVAHPSRGGQTVVFPAPVRPTVLEPRALPDRQFPAWGPELLPAVATTAGVNLSVGSWATSLSGLDLGISAVAAVLRNAQGPTSQEQVERAVVLAVLPGLLQAKFDIETAETWRQVIGVDNMALTSIAAVAIPWNDVVRRARIEGVLDIDPDGRWSAGPDVQDAPSRELDARAIVSLSYLAHVGFEEQEVTTQLGVLRAG